MSCQRTCGVIHLTPGPGCSSSVVGGIFNSALLCVCARGLGLKIILVDRLGRDVPHYRADGNSEVNSKLNSHILSSPEIHSIKKGGCWLDPQTLTVATGSARCERNIYPRAHFEEHSLTHILFWSYTVTVPGN